MSYCLTATEIEARQVDAKEARLRVETGDMGIKFIVRVIRKIICVCELQSHELYRSTSP